jgi:hypothetical protein
VVELLEVAVDRYLPVGDELPEVDPELVPEPEDEVPEEVLPLVLVLLVPLELVVLVPPDVLPLPLVVVLPEELVEPPLCVVPELVPVDPVLPPEVVPVLEELSGDEAPPVSDVEVSGKPVAPGTGAELVVPPPVVEAVSFFWSVEAVMLGPPAPPLEDAPLRWCPWAVTGRRSCSSDPAAAEGVCVSEEAPGDGEVTAAAASCR